MANDLQKIIDQSGLEPSKAQYILDHFTEYFQIAADWEQKAKAVVVTDASQTAEMAMARAGRLFLRDKRIQIENARKQLKEQALREGKAIDGIANILKALIVPIEQYLDQQEHFVEYRQKAEEEQKRIEAEQKAEADRIAAEEAARQEQERIRQENEKLKWEAEAREKAMQAEREKNRREQEKREAAARREREKREAAEKKAREARAKAVEAERKRKEAEAAKKKALADQKYHDELRAKGVPGRCPYCEKEFVWINEKAVRF